MLDVVVIALTVALAISSIATSEPFEPTAVSLALLAVACVAVPWRYRYPEPVLAATLLGVLVTTTAAPAMLALGSLAESYGTRIRTWAAAAAASVVFLARWAEPLDALTVSLEWAVIVCLPAAVGLYLHTRQVAIDEAVALAAARDAMAKAARQDERTRIAREMHDVLAHKISLIALHAGALELTAEGTQTSQTAAIVGQTARQALEELRSVIGVLRTEQGDQRTPQPSITDLDRVIDEWREAGTHVTLQDMTPAGYLDTVPTQVGRAAYRIVQESLTNASKHAPGSTIEIVMQALDGSLDLAVHNRAAARVSSRATTGSGTGLIGLRERVDLLGGCFEAGPDERGGYRVHARLPLNTVEH